MLLVFIAILVVLCLGFWVLSEKVKGKANTCFENIGGVTAVLAVIALIILVMGCIFLAVSGPVEAKIELCQQQNEALLADLNTMTAEYATYENETYVTAGKTGDKILYPAANGATLIEQKMKIYNSKNNELRDFQQTLVSIKMWRWLVYFGG